MDHLSAVKNLQALILRARSCRCSCLSKISSLVRLLARRLSLPILFIFTKLIFRLVIEVKITCINQDFLVIESEKVMVKFTPEQAMKALRWSRGIALLCL